MVLTNVAHVPNLRCHLFFLLILIQNGHVFERRLTGIESYYLLSTPAVVVAPPAPQIVKKWSKRCVICGSKFVFMTKFTVSLWYPREQFYTNFNCSPPGDITKIRCSRNLRPRRMCSTRSPRRVPLAQKQAMSGFSSIYDETHKNQRMDHTWGCLNPSSGGSCYEEKRDCPSKVEHGLGARSSF